MGHYHITGGDLKLRQQQKHDPEVVLGHLVLNVIIHQEIHIIGTQIPVES